MLTALSLMLATQAKAPVPKPAEQAEQGITECPFKMTERAMIVDATINGKKVSLMFDTGFSAWADVDAGINIGKPDGTVNVKDFVGTFEAKTVKIKTLQLGSKSMDLDKDAFAMMTPGGDNSASYGTHCDGLMGLSVIKNTITEINFEKGKFIFYPKSFDITKRVPDNKKTFLTKMLPAGMSSIEMLVKTDAGKSMVLALDTGNGFYATTHNEVLDRIGLWPISKKPAFMSVSYVASGPVDSWNVKIPKVTIFGVPVENSVWNIINLPPSSADSDGTVGFGFLKNFNIIIDYERRRVWLENFTGKFHEDDPAEIGMNVVWDKDRKSYVVFRVQPNGPAEKAGVKRGDSLLSVDGDEALDIGFDRMRSKLEGKPGSKVKLALSRTGSLYRVEIERVPLINVVGQ